MNRYIVALFYGGILSGSLVAAPASVKMDESIKQVDAAAPTTLQPHRAFISRSTLTAGESDELMQIEVALKMPRFTEFQARLGKRERISKAELAAKYEPSAADYQAVVDWLTSLGLTITSTDPNHVAIFARGKVSRLGKAFNVNFARVTADQTEYTSAISAPSVPDTIAPLIVGINGLQPHIRPHRHAVVRPSDLNSAYAPYLPSQLAHVYDADTLYSTGISGTNQTIAIVIDTGPSTTDLTSFWNTYNVKQTLGNITMVPVVTGTVTAPSLEATLDVEWASSIAPKAQVRVYTTQTLSVTSLDLAYQQILSDATNTPGMEIHQMSMSYGLGETYWSSSEIATDQNWFALLVNAGVTPFASTGDAGSTPDATGHAESGPLQVEYPSSDPSVIAVGGTSLYVDQDGNVSNETAWSETGGGVSQLFARPSWQSGNGVPTGSSRLVPDVSSAADPDTGAVLIYNGANYIIGGTSWSSPTWAAFCALFNQVHARLTPVGSPPSFGGLGPYLYPLIGTSSFRDILHGSNSTPYSGTTNGVPNYMAGPGYDLTTGIGVPDVQQLASALSPYNGQPLIYNTPTDGTVLAPYSFSYQYEANNPTFSLASGKLPPGLTLSSTGTLSGIPSQAGTYTGSVQVTSAGGTNSADFNITVNPANYFVLHRFGDGSVGNDGIYPNNLIQGKDGNLYGTTYAGGTGKFYENALITVTLGTFFQISTTGSYTILHNFGDGTVANDGESPNTGLVQGIDGNFYGSTVGGGVTPAGYTGPLGTFFKITSTGTETVTRSVLPGDNITLGYGSIYGGGGGESRDDLIPGSNGNFFGTAYASGTSGSGGFYLLTPSGGFNLLYTFTGVQNGLSNGGPNDGNGPNCLIHGQDGNLYGTTTNGGVEGDGTAFVVSTTGSEHDMHDFSGDLPSFGIHGGGINPLGLVQSSTGTFYGATASAGTAGFGEFFAMDSSGNVTTLHNFGDNSVASDGNTPDCAPILGNDGNFYGTTSAGGANKLGVVYQITPTGSVTIIHSFSANDGIAPHTLIQGTDGLYGTTYSGSLGTGSYGEVFKIGAQSQTITFGAIPNQVVGSAVNLNAVASSGLPVSFTVTGPATLSGSTLTTTGIGTVTVTASQPGNGTISAAAPVTQSFQVTGQTQTISFPAIGSQTVGATVTLNATASSGLVVSYAVSGPAAFVVNGLTTSGNTLTLTGTGTVTATAMQPGNNAFEPAMPVTISFPVAKAAQTVTFPAIPNQVVGATFPLSATASSGLPITYTYSGGVTVTGTTAKVTASGTCNIRASQNGNANYTAATSVLNTFTATKASQTITFPGAPNQTVGGKLTLGATASSGLAVTYSLVSGPATLSSGVLTFTGVGTVTVHAAQAGNSQYAAAAPVNQTFTVSPASQTITFPAIPATTYGNSPTLSATASSGLPVSYSVVSGPATVAGNVVTLTGVGTVVIQASQAGNANYNVATPVNQSFTVGKGSQTVTFPAIPNQIAGATFTLNATASSGLPITYTYSGSVTVAGTTAKVTASGTCNIRASQNGNANYTAATSVLNTFTATKASQTITFPGAPNQIVGGKLTLSATASSGLAVTYSLLSGPATLSSGVLTFTGLGTVTVHASQAGNSQYAAATPVNQTFTIAPTPQTITFPAIPATTYGNSPTLGATSSSGLTVSYSVVSGPATVAGNVVTLTGVGTVVIQASQAGNANYSAAATVNQSFTVGKGSQTVTFPPIPTQTVGETFSLNATASSGLPITYTYSGDVTVTGTTAKVYAAGTCNIRASQNGNANYTAATSVLNTFTSIKAN